MQIDKRVLRVLFLILLIIIEYLATTTREMILVESIWDKANHFMAFFVLYVIFSMAYENISLLKKVLLLILFGWQIEIVQSFIPGRFYSLYDIVADTIGILIGVIACYSYEYLKKRVREVSS
jgi:VanZ family protein